MPVAPIRSPRRHGWHLHGQRRFNWTIGRVSMDTLNNQTNEEGTSVSLAACASDNVNSPRIAKLDCRAG